MTDTTYDAGVENDDFDENAVSEYTSESAAPSEAAPRPSASAPGAGTGCTPSGAPRRPWRARRGGGGIRGVRRGG